MPVFISHSHQDKEFVDRLATHLIKHNAHVWVDRWEIKVGDSILKQIQDKIQDASAILFVLSKASVESEWCKKELSAGLMRELEEKAVIVLPVLLEECTIPIFLKEKRYADFTKNFDIGLKEIVDSLASITNANRGHIENIEYHVDWTQEWVTNELGRLILQYILVEHSKELPYTILTNIHIFCNEEATRRYNQFKEIDLGWFGRAAITEVLSEYGEKHNLRLPLTDHMEHEYKFATGDRKNGRRYDVYVKYRWLGQDIGNDIIVDVSNHFKLLRDFMEAINRPLSADEKEKLSSLLRS